MAKKFAKAFYNSTAWKQCRSSYIKSVHGLCERCGRPGYIVHHKEVLTSRNINDPSVTLNWDKLEYLCQDCHNKEYSGSEKEITREGFSFNEAAFMKITLAEIRQVLLEEGTTEWFEQGEQKFKRKHPSVDIYTTMVNRYSNVMKQLIDLLPPEEKKEEVDSLMQFVKKGISKA